MLLFTNLRLLQGITARLRVPICCGGAAYFALLAIIPVKRSRQFPFGNRLTSPADHAYPGLLFAEGNASTNLPPTPGQMLPPSTARLP
jgi:hypothetical protein